MRRTLGLLLATASFACLARATPGRADVPWRAANPMAPAPTGDDSTGRVLFTENCQKCHGARGIPVKVIKQKFPRIPIMDAAFFAARSDDSVVTILTNGKSDVMVSWKAKFSVEEMKAIAAYIRTFAK
jgi:mono/diheme cytochrome c family protein